MIAFVRYKDGIAQNILLNQQIIYEGFACKNIIKFL